MRPRHRLLPALVATLAAGSASAQRPPLPSEQDPEIPRAVGAFDLDLAGIAVSGVRSTGYTTGCVTSAPVAQYFQYGCTSPLLGQVWWEAGTSVRTHFFDVALVLAAPPSDFPRRGEATPVVGGGWTVLTAPMTVAPPAGGADKIRPAGSQLAPGVLSTDDGACTDFSAPADGYIRTGHQLLPVSGCPVTHPSTGWAGRPHVSAEALLKVAGSAGDDPFATWRFPSFPGTGAFRGDWHTYGEASDHTPELLALYGGVTPPGSGEPAYAGWPLGVSVRFDAFQHHLEPAARAWYWDGLIINRSEEVWGEPRGYDSLYVGLYFGVLFGLEVHYYDAARGALVFNMGGDGCIGHPEPPGVRCRASSRGWENGGWGIAVLKSPLGDLRNKLLSDPESPFHQPGHPRAGDTITFQHERMCGYGGCYFETARRGQRAHFGVLSSTGGNVLDGRHVADFAAGSYYRIFRPEDWPERSGRFNAYVPGVHDGRPIWDWNHDGLPDTIHADTCGSRGCVALFSDTTPGGYAHGYGNIAYLAAGPIRVEPGDTLPLTLAFVAAPDSAGFEAALHNTIGFYRRFYEPPGPPPQASLSVVDRAPGGRLTLAIGDEPEEWRDPWLTWIDPGGDLELNPWLADSIRARATDNVAALHLFLSCDGGSTWADEACVPAPAGTDTTWRKHGWLPFRTLEPDAEGRLPDTVQLAVPQSGRHYVVAAVAESRGATWPLERRLAEGPGVTPVTWAPALLATFPPVGEPGRLEAYAPVGEEAVAGDLSRVHMVPNPFLVYSAYQTSEAASVRFTYMPPEGRLRIFDVGGAFIQQITWEEGDLVEGDLPFSLVTREGLPMAAGLYVWVLETPDGRRALGKFVIVR